LDVPNDSVVNIAVFTVFPIDASDDANLYLH